MSAWPKLTPCPACGGRLRVRWESEYHGGYQTIWGPGPDFGMSADWVEWVEWMPMFVCHGCGHAYHTTDTWLDDGSRGARDQVLREAIHAFNRRRNHSRPARRHHTRPPRRRKEEWAW